MHLADKLWAPAQARRATARLGLTIMASIAVHVALAQGFGFVPAESNELRPGPAPMQAQLIRRSGPEQASRGSPRSLPAAAPVGLPVLPEAEYLPGSDLDRRPTALRPIEPQFPAGAAQEGYLVLRLLINEKGSVDRVAVLVSDPEGIFDRSAVSAFESARFAPGMRHGAPVKSQMVVELKYDPRSGQSAP